VIDILKIRCGLLPEHHVADVGAGTGMLSEIFLQHGNSVVAIEPNDEMRAACEQLASAWPGLLVKKGTAEETGLEPASVDFVAAGRAFHWFDITRARPEFQKILRPAGWVVLATNSRVRDDSPQSMAYEALLSENGTDYAANRKRYEIGSTIDEFFRGGEHSKEEIAGEQRLTLEELVGFTQSLSVSPQPSHPKYEGMQAALREFFAKWKRDDEVVVIPTVCRITYGRFTAMANASTQ
jgi:SAM-dependent methyltransferase